MKYNNKDLQKCAQLVKTIDCTVDVDVVIPVEDKYEIHLASRGDELDFDLLNKLSKLFKTKLINIGSEKRDDGFCDTCSYEYSVVTIRLDGATM